MPLNEYGEKLDSNGYAPSILHDKPVCLICGRYGTARHEVYFGSAYRAKSKRLGLWVTLCPWCHQNGPTAIHNNHDTHEGRMQLIGIIIGQYLLKACLALLDTPFFYFFTRNADRR